MPEDIVEELNKVLYEPFVRQNDLKPEHYYRLGVIRALRVVGTYIDEVRDMTQHELYKAFTKQLEKECSQIIEEAQQDLSDKRSHYKSGIKPSQMPALWYSITHNPMFPVE